MTSRSPARRHQKNSRKNAVKASSVYLISDDLGGSPARGYPDEYEEPAHHPSRAGVYAAGVRDQQQDHHAQDGGNFRTDEGEIHFVVSAGNARQWRVA